MAATPVELKGFGRPPSFNGRDDQWPDWSFVMRAYLATVGDELSTLLERVEGTTTPVTVAELERNVPGITSQLRQSYYQLAMTCTGPALGVIKAVEKNNGLEAWRRLHQRYEPDGGARLQNMMTRILNQVTSQRHHKSSKLHLWCGNLSLRNGKLRRAQT